VICSVPSDNRDANRHLAGSMYDTEPVYRRVSNAHIHGQTTELEKTTKRDTSKWPRVTATHARSRDSIARSALGQAVPVDREQPGAEVGEVGDKFELFRPSVN
jgi:hypothetical protein